MAIKCPCINVITAVLLLYTKTGLRLEMKSHAAAISILSPPSS